MWSRSPSQSVTIQPTSSDQLARVGDPLTMSETLGSSTSLLQQRRWSISYIRLPTKRGGDELAGNIHLEGSTETHGSDVVRICSQNRPKVRERCPREPLETLRNVSNTRHISHHHANAGIKPRTTRIETHRTGQAVCS